MKVAKPVVLLRMPLMKAAYAKKIPTDSMRGPTFTCAYKDHQSQPAMGQQQAGTPLTMHVRSHRQTGGVIVKKDTAQPTDRRRIAAQLHSMNRR